MLNTNGNGRPSTNGRIHYAHPEEVVVAIIPSRRAAKYRGLREKRFNFFPPRTIHEYLRVVDSLRRAGVAITKQMRSAIHVDGRDPELVRSFHEMLVEDDYAAMIGFAILSEKGWEAVQLVRSPVC